jgi:N-acetylglucosaminyl-diphospho-decaprenol L-rhamnosyltransferase
VDTPADDERERAAATAHRNAADHTEDPRGPAAEIDVVIVTADTREMTLACVATLRSEPRLSITVVDNGSSDGTVEALRAQPGDLPRIVELDPPVGFAGACNRGAELGQAPFVLFLNSDILTLSGSIKGLLTALEHDPQAVVAGGRLVDPDDLATQPGYRPRRFPTLVSFAMILTGVEARWPTNPISRRYHGLDLDDEITQPVSQPAAAALMVRRASFDAVGGFDERFWFWFEDSDLLRRLSEEGRILWVPSAPFRHAGGASFSRWGRVQQIRSRYQGMLQYGAAHFGAAERILLGILTMATSLPWILRLHRRRPEEAAAWRAIMRGGGALARGRPVPQIVQVSTASRRRD